MIGLLGGAFLLAATFAPGPAAATNICRADNGVTCATGMPIDGYCECHADGQVQEGTVVGAMTGRTQHASRADCTANPQAPGCVRR
jgi:hypothetical protein